MFVLMVCFISGLGVKMYREHWAPLPVVAVEHQNTDGVQVIEQTENGPLSLNSKQFEGCININQATIEELQGLPGIGSVIAKRIYDDRMGRGAYHSIDELLQVKGIGSKKLDRLRPFVKIK